MQEPISLNAITTIIASHLKKELDVPFKLMLAAKVDMWRSTLVQRAIDKNEFQRKFFTQTLYVPLQCTTPVPCLPGSMLPAVAKSMYEVPQPMRGASLFDYVGGVDGRSAFKTGSAGTSVYLQASKYRRGAVFYEWENNYLIVNQSSIPWIRVDGVFDKPLEVMQLNCKGRQNCDEMNARYPCTGDMQQMIIQYILQVDYNLRIPGLPAVQEVEVKPTVDAKA